MTDLRSARYLLDWDQQVAMPRAAGPVRAEQLATLERVAHERFISDEIGRLLERLRPYEESLDPESDEASLIRVSRRDWEKERRVPSSLRAEIARAGARGYQAWMDARARSDFEVFRPALEVNLALARRYVECFDGHEDPYDPLLDDYEPGMTTREAAAVLSRLREELAPLIAAVGDGEPRPAFLAGPFPVDDQRRFDRLVLDRLGFDSAHWRFGEIPHPAEYSFATTDVRIGTRYADHQLESIFSTLHEFGHGLYERQVDPALERTPLATGVSLGLHESQSRLWENLVGRSTAFWRYFYPRLQELFAGVLGDVELEAFCRAVNRVEPSLIRVDADEVTYNLHVALRFELERELLSEQLAPRELPEAWNARMNAYLGVDVPDDAHGVLQDSHWSGGAFGYFATYSLGNVFSVQIWNRLRGELPGLDAEIESGQFTSLREWLRENVHRFGRKLTPAETLERAAGAAPDPGPYLTYLRAKVGAVHGVDVAV